MQQPIFEAFEALEPLLLKSLGLETSIWKWKKAERTSIETPVLARQPDAIVRKVLQPGVKIGENC